MKTTLLDKSSNSKIEIYQTLQCDRMKDKEQLYFWKQVQIQNIN
jgi:hypothetical protein